MNKNSSTIVTGLAIIISVAAITLALSASRKQRTAEAAAERLRLQLAEAMKSPSRTETDRRTTAREAVKVETNTVAGSAAEVTGEDNDRRPKERESWEERMARLKAEDPEAYAQMIKARDEWMQKTRYRLAERTANFMELDTSFMTDAEFENHQQLIQNMAAIWELNEQFQDPEQPRDRETMRELAKLMMETRPLMKVERDTMFRQLGLELGLQGKEAEAFSGYIDDIISTTSIGSTSRGMRGGGGSGGGSDSDKR